MIFLKSCFFLGQFVIGTQTSYWLFVILILYPATLLKECMSSEQFLGESLGSVRYRVVTFVGPDDFTLVLFVCFFFLFVSLFISLSFLIALTKSSSTILEREETCVFY